MILYYKFQVLYLWRQKQLVFWIIAGLTVWIFITFLVLAFFRGGHIPHGSETKQ